MFHTLLLPAIEQERRMALEQRGRVRRLLEATRECCARGSRSLRSLLLAGRRPVAC
jgi:hypothetical protein